MNRKHTYRGYAYEIHPIAAEGIYIIDIEGIREVVRAQDATPNAVLGMVERFIDELAKEG